MIMSIVPATFLLIMALSSAIIAWLVAREVAKRIAGPTSHGDVGHAPLPARLPALLEAT
jgi:hypothetical protein